MKLIVIIVVIFNWNISSISLETNVTKQRTTTTNDDDENKVNRAQPASTTNNPYEKDNKAETFIDYRKTYHQQQQQHQQHEPTAANYYIIDEMEKPFYKYRNRYDYEHDQHRVYIPLIEQAIHERRNEKFFYTPVKETSTSSLRMRPKYGHQQQQQQQQEELFIAVPIHQASNLLRRGPHLFPSTECQNVVRPTTWQHQQYVPIAATSKGGEYVWVQTTQDGGAHIQLQQFVTPNEWKPLIKQHN